MSNVKTKGSKRSTSSTKPRAPATMRGSKARTRNAANSQVENAKKPKSSKDRSTKTAGGKPHTRSPKAAEADPPNSRVKAPTRTRSKDTRFPIVGIGASAGGLEALQTFFEQVPDDSGLAFVVIQHLIPTHKAMMAELLQRASSIPVSSIEDRMKVEPDHVYVIPPNKDVSILHGVLHLLPPIASRGLHLPIDHFFRSLADDQQEHSIGVVLSGMGMDGALGLRAIKERAGASFVQAPASAKFEGMPQSAIESGVADVVAPVEALPSKIIAYTRFARRVGHTETEVEEVTQGALEKVLILLRTHTGNDFSSYKKSTVYRRVERRMGLHQIEKISVYVRYLRENSQEIELLFKELLIGVTKFFRDPAAWDHLSTEVLPKLIADAPAGTTLRGWVPGCSTGEEAYSLAILFKEAIDWLQPDKSIGLQLFATDLDRDAIEVARVGLYPLGIAADVSASRLRRYFVQDERGYRVTKTIREMVVFAPQNLVMDPPFTRLDILSCRNLLIYLEARLQKRLIPLFHYSLNPGGVLFLGSAETVGTYTGLFAQLDDRWRLYRRLATAKGTQVEFPSALTVNAAAAQVESVNGAVPTSNVQTLVNYLLVQRFSPPGVICNDRGDIVYVSGRTGRYLEHAAGKANLNIFAMAREGLRRELTAAFAAALRQSQAVTVRDVRVGTNGTTQTIDLTVERLTHPEPLRGMVLVVFVEVITRATPTSKKPVRGEPGRGRIVALKTSLQDALDESQVLREQMQNSKEELMSTNEELQSANEELQSTNEELTTSKEELQSLNEELQTVNQELQAKVNELSRSNNDMKNLLNSTNIATLFLNNDLHVRRFTPHTANIIKLIPSDIGRPITDITSKLEYPELVAHAREVVRTLVPRETVARDHDDHWFTVRILPYRTADNVIDGVVVTFMDTPAAKSLEAALRDQTARLRQMAESLPTLVWGARPDGAWDYLSRQWLDYTGVTEAEHLGFGWLEQIHSEDRTQMELAWHAATREGTPLHLNVRIRARTGEHRWFKIRSTPVRDPEGRILHWYGASTDVEDLKEAETERESRSRNDSPA